MDVNTTAPVWGGEELHTQKHLGINVECFSSLQGRNEDSKKGSINIGCISRNMVLRTREVQLHWPDQCWRAKFCLGPQPREDSDVPD